MSKKIDILRAMAERIKNQPRDERGRWVETGITQGAKAIGNLVGEATIGPPGAIAGSVIGSAVGRVAGKTISAAMSGSEKAKQDERFDRLSALEKLQQITNFTIEEMASPAFQEDIKKAVVGDIEAIAFAKLGGAGLDAAGIDNTLLEMVGATGAAMLGSKGIQKFRGG